MLGLYSVLLLIGTDSPISFIIFLGGFKPRLANLFEIKNEIFVSHPSQITNQTIYTKYMLRCNFQQAVELH
jgi:hypothetical protein